MYCAEGTCLRENRSNLLSCKIRYVRNAFNLDILRCLFLSVFLTFSPSFASQTESFSAVDGIRALQVRAPGNATLASIYSKWKNAIQFYVSSGISRLPKALITDLRSAGITVENTLSQQEIDSSFATAASSTGVVQPGSNSTSPDPSLPVSATETISGGQGSTASTIDNAADNTGSNAASTETSQTPGGASLSGTGSAESSNSSDSSGGGESTGTSGSSNNGSTQSSVEESGLLGGNNGRTSYLVSTQFGRIIQALGGNSAGGVNRAAARGFVNYNGSKPPSLHSDLPVNSGGSNIPSSAGTNGSSPDTSGGITGGVISGSGDQVSGGGGSGSDGGSSGSSTAGSSGGSSGDTGDVSGGSNAQVGYNAADNYTCSLGAYGGQCVKYVRDQFVNHPGVSGLSPLCGASSDPDEDCGAKFSYLNDLWDLGYGKGVTPRKNSVAVWYSQNSDYGHMAVVYDVSLNSDGTYTIMIHDSNWTGNETQMCAIPYEVNTSTMETFRNGNPNPKTLIGFIYGEPEESDSNSNADGSTTGGSITTGSTDGTVVAGGTNEGSTNDSGGTGTSSSPGNTSETQGDRKSVV